MPVSAGAIALPDRFAVGSHIANGGMASVWAAEDRVLGRRVAVKLLAPQYTGDPAAKARFLREARAAAALSSHPHVVTIFDVGEHDGHPYIVMERLGGGTVADALRAGPVPRERALAWLRQAAEALDAAHAAGVVQRDVKPGNLLLDERGRLAVGDFGIALVALEDALTATGEVLGTAAYVSPEQVSGRPATAASDVYALGVVAYRLLAGRTPFAGASFAAQARAHVEAEPAPPSRAEPSLPAAVDRVMLRALAKDPAERWPTATAFVDALKGTLSEREPTAAARALPGERGSRPGRGGDRRRRRLAAGAVLAGGVAVVGVAVALLAGGSSGTTRSEAAAPKTTTAARPAARPTSAPAPASDPAALNDEGFRRMQDGRYGDAIPPLRRAVDAACGPGAGLTCAYALYNLGRSLRLAGQPAQAIPFLERRLQFPDQREVVQRELDLARREAGQATPATPAPSVAPTPPGHSGGKPGKGEGKQGGAGGGD